MADDVRAMRTAAWEFYRTGARSDLPWRQPEADGSFDPYKILVSELMLQQTQVPRVVPKFAAFVQRFPTTQRLAEAPLGEVLRAWQGLGYNRRAKFLWQAARTIMEDFEGQLPQTAAELIRLPGVGANTAGAILAYAFNQPAVFVETNVRTVCIYHCFRDESAVSDAQVQEAMRAAVAHEPDPRDWYWAIMDYGTYLKQTIGNAARLSASYARQSAFAGSRRQLRGQVLRSLVEEPRTIAAMSLDANDPRLPDVIATLIDEGLIVRVAGRDTFYALAS